MIEISGSLTWSKPLMELIFNPCGEFRWSSEGPVSQIHSPHLHVGTPGIFSDHLRSVTTSIQSLIKLQPWFLSLRWKTCPWLNCSLGSCACSEGPALGQNTLMMMMMMKHLSFSFRNLLFIKILNDFNWQSRPWWPWCNTEWTELLNIGVLFFRKFFIALEVFVQHWKRKQAKKSREVWFVSW